MGWLQRIFGDRHKDNDNDIEEFKRQIEDSLGKTRQEHEREKARARALLAAAEEYRLRGKELQLLVKRRQE